jgi:hypothetical protein
MGLHDLHSLPNTHYLHGQVKGDEVSEVCGTYRGGEKCVSALWGGETLRKETTWKTQA